jgi:transposase
LEGHRSGRPRQLTSSQQNKFCKIIDGDPNEQGHTSAIWTSIMISEVVYEEFAIDYHPRHVRKLLQQMNYSMQKPKRVLVKADESQKIRWKRYVYPNIKKKPMK